MKSFFCILIATVIVACKDGTEFSPVTIDGHLTLKDEYREESFNGENVKVYLLKGDKNEAFYSTKTDKEGNFTFSHRPNGDFYLSIDTLIKNTEATFKDTLTKTTTLDNNKKFEWEVKANYGTSLKVKVITKGTKKEPLNDMPVFVFANETFARIAKDTASHEVTKYIKTGNTNSNGLVFFPNVGKNNLYILCKGKIGKISLSSEITPFSFDPTKIVPIEIEVETP